VLEVMSLTAAFLTIAARDIDQTRVDHRDASQSASGARSRGPLNLKDPFKVVYESPALLAADRDLGAMVQAIDRAVGRFCLGVTESLAIPNFVPIHVDLPEPWPVAYA